MEQTTFSSAPQSSLPREAVYPIPANVQGQVAWDSGQPDLEGGSPAQGSEVGMDSL